MAKKGKRIGHKRKTFRSGAKGHAFENKVAKQIVAELGDDFEVTRQDCYRTPLSGGHRFARGKDPGDIVISPRFRILFPFLVECKHDKRFDVHHLFHPAERRKSTWMEDHFINQAVQQVDPSSYNVPLVIVRGNLGDTFVFYPSPWKGWSWPEEFEYITALRFQTKKHGLWVCILLEDFLKGWHVSLPDSRRKAFENFDAEEALQ